jgi:hypothetical protein
MSLGFGQEESVRQNNARCTDLQAEVGQGASGNGNDLINIDLHPSPVAIDEFFHAPKGRGMFHQ